jgi:hypothetical protein
MRKLTTVSIWFILALSAGQFSIAAAQECAPYRDYNFLCGPNAVEDLVRVPGTPWFVGSGMSGNRTPGKLHLIDTGQRIYQWLIRYPGFSDRTL